MPMLVIDGRGTTVGELGKVELRDDAVFLGRESDGADDRGFGGGIAGCRRGAAFLVDALVLRRSG